MIVATGAQGEAIQKLHRMIAASSAFQVRVRTYGQGELDAGKFVHSPYLNDPDQTQRPFAVVMQGDLDWYRVSGGKSNSMLTKGTLKLMIADNKQQPESDLESICDFRNFVDAVLEDLASMSGSDDWLNISEMSQIQEVSETDPRDVADNGMAAIPYYNCAYEIVWDSI